MEKYKIKIKKRIKLLTVLICFIGVCITILFYLHFSSWNITHISDFIQGYQVGVLIGVEIVLFVSLLIYCKSLKNSDFCQKQYIKENDERLRIIQLKSASFSSISIMLILALASVVSGFFSITVVFTLLSVLILFIILAFVSQLYFEKHI